MTGSLHTRLCHQHNHLQKELDLWEFLESCCAVIPAHPCELCTFTWETPTAEKRNCFQSEAGREILLESSGLILAQGLHLHPFWKERTEISGSAATEQHWTSICLPAPHSHGDSSSSSISSLFAFISCSSNSPRPPAFTTLIWELHPSQGHLLPTPGKSCQHLRSAGIPQQKQAKACLPAQSHWSSPWAQTPGNTSPPGCASSHLILSKQESCRRELRAALPAVPMWAAQDFTPTQKPRNTLQNKGHKLCALHASNKYTASLMAALFLLYMEL